MTENNSSTSTWDVCIVGIDLKRREVQRLFNEDFLNELDKEYEIIGYNYYDRYSYTAYLKIKRIKGFEEVIEDAVDQIISQPLRDDLLTDDVKEDLDKMPQSFKVRPVIFKDIRGQKWTVEDFNQIRAYILSWKELAKIIFYFIQMGEGDDLAHYLWREHPAIFSEVHSRKDFLKNTILAEFANVLERFEEGF